MWGAMMKIEVKQQGDVATASVGKKNELNIK